MQINKLIGKCYNQQVPHLSRIHTVLFLQFKGTGILLLLHHDWEIASVMFAKLIVKLIPRPFETGERGIRYRSPSCPFSPELKNVIQT